MLRPVLPFLVIAGAAAGGSIAGHMLRSPEPAEQADVAAVAERPADSAPAAAHDYVKMNNQFVVPVVERGRVAALVILALSLEVPAGGGDAVFTAEPKLRDAFLRVLFDHANSGGFSGSFTESAALAPLRTALLEAGQGVLGDKLSNVLIGDIVRQDN